MNKCTCNNCNNDEICNHDKFGFENCGKWTPKWISVKDALPEIAGLPVLMVAEDIYGQKAVVKGFTNYDCPVEFSTHEIEYSLTWQSAWKVTHWMPLPEPPAD